jgi:integrase
VGKQHLTERRLLCREKVAARKTGLQHIATHDLRRTCAKLCHTTGGEIEQIQFPLGHASVQTTERYLGCKRTWGIR